MGDMDAINVGLFADDVRAVAAHYGVAEREVVLAPAQGQVNLTVFLGGELVLRIPRTRRGAEQLSKEAVVIPLVQDAGVPTADLIGYDPTRSVASAPYMVLHQVHGGTFAEQPVDPVRRRRTLESLGETLATLHQVRLSKTGPLGAIPAPYEFSFSEVLDRLVEAGEIGSAQYEWLAERFAVLQPEGPSLADPVLVHRDVISSNVMVDREGRVTALLDWGSAEWGSPARDFVGLPIRALPDPLFGYRSILAVTPAGGDGHGDLGLERDALWYHLYLALTRLMKEPSTSEDRNWAAPRSATLIDILAFSSDAALEPWPDLLRHTSPNSAPPSQSAS